MVEEVSEDATGNMIIVVGRGIFNIHPVLHTPNQMMKARHRLLITEVLSGPSHSPLIFNNALSEVQYIQLNSFGYLQRATSNDIQNRWAMKCLSLPLIKSSGVSKKYQIYRENENR